MFFAIYFSILCKTNGIIRLFSCGLKNKTRLDAIFLVNHKCRTFFGVKNKPFVQWLDACSVPIFYVKMSQSRRIIHCMRSIQMCHVCISSECMSLLSTIRHIECVHVYVKYKLMVAECCSFFALSYSFQSINKFDRLIRINRPNVKLQ